MIYFLIWLLGMVVIFVWSALYHRITNKPFESAPWDDVLPNAVLVGVFIIGWPVAVPAFMFFIGFHLVFIQALPWLWRKIAGQ
jgi:hypothetical protein